VGWSPQFARSSIPYRKDSWSARRQKIKFGPIDNVREALADVELNTSARIAASDRILNSNVI